MAGFTLENVEDYDAHELGFCLKYRSAEHPEIRADVFVYPIELPDLVSLSHVMELENSGLESEIALVAQTYDQVVGLVTVESYTPQGGGILLPGLLGYREITQVDRTLQSYSFLTVNKNLFLKLRMTLPDFTETEARDRFRLFLDSVSSSLKARVAPRRKLGIVVTRTTTDNASAGNSCALSSSIGYGVSMLISLNKNEYLDTFQRELAARETALDVWEELLAKPESDCTSTAFSTLSRARAAGFLPEYIWEAYRRDYWLPPKSLETSRFIDWARTELPKHDPIQPPGILVRWSD
jgi:hypothetical protein